MSDHRKTRRTVYVFAAALAVSCAGSKSGVQREQYQYDSNGRLVSYTGADGNTSSCRYDTRGRPTEVNFWGGRTEYGYDVTGNRAWMADGTGLTQYYYDAFDRLSAVASRHSPWRFALYDYDDRHNLTHIWIYDMGLMKQEQRYRRWLAELMRESSEKNRQLQEQAYRELAAQLRAEAPERLRNWCRYDVGYEHDLAGNLTAVRTGAGTVTYTHLPDQGRIVRELPNGIRTTFDYNPTGQLTRLRHDGPTGVIAEYRYDHNAAGRVTAAHELTGAGTATTRFEWDARGYLGRLTMPDGTWQRFEYDAMGNRTRMQDATGWHDDTFDALGRLTRAGDRRFEWDAAGNLARETRGAERYQFGYDGRGLLLDAKGPGLNARYGWDGDGNMVRRQVGNELTDIVPNPLAAGGLPLAEFDRTGDLTAGYIYGDGLLGRIEPGGAARFFLEDGFNSVRLATGTDGAILGRVDYTPFAQPFNRQGDLGCDFRTAGDRLMPELGAYAINGRIYDPGTGRFNNPNPTPGFLERFDSQNQYAHSCNSRTLFAEPRCNQTHGRRTNVLVGGATARQPRIDVEARTFGYDVGFAAGSGPGGWLGFVGDGAWAMWDQTTGGLGTHTADNLYDKLTSVGDIGTLGVHSWGAITLGNMSQLLDDALTNGSIRIGKVVFLGADPNDRLLAVLNKHGVPHEARCAVPGGGVEPYLGRFNDPVPIWTRTNIEIGSDLYPGAWRPMQWAAGGLAKVGAAIGFIPNPWERSSLEGHRLDHLLDATPSDRWPDVPPPRIDFDRKLFRRQDFPPFPPDWPDGGGGAVAGGGRLCDPMAEFDDQLGGIELAAAGELVGDLGRVTGAVYDSATQQVVLLGDREYAGPAMRAEDLAVALRLVYGPNPHDPEFTLDPADPTNPEGRWLRAVYIPEDVLAGTSFGQDMFEADWVLKQYSFGVVVRPDGSVIDRRPGVAGVMSVADLMFADSAGPRGSSRWARFWIVSDEMKLVQSGNTVRFDIAQMRVKAKRIVPDPTDPQGFHDIDAEDPIVNRFAGAFTEHYDELARESPELARVRELAKALALAKWMKQRGVPVDIEWVERNIRRRQTTDRVTALAVPRTRTSTRRYQRGDDSMTETRTVEVHLFGGVDLTVTPSFSAGDPQVGAALEAGVARELARAGAEPVFEARTRAETLQAAVLPVTTGGRAAWQRTPVVVARGASHYLNHERKVVRSVSDGGDTTRYTYGDGGKLSGVEVAGPGGRLSGERGSRGSNWRFVSARGNEFDCAYGTDGWLKSVDVDGRRLATYSVSPERREVRVEQSGCTERLQYSESGTLERYELAGDGSAPLVVDYNNQGRPVRSSGPGLATVTATYALDGTTPVKVATPRGAVTYRYGDRGELLSVDGPGGTTVEYGHDGERLSSLSVKSAGDSAGYAIAEDGTVNGRDLFGGTASFRYSAGLLVVVEQGSFGRATYSYEAGGRLSAMSLPDGRQVRFLYKTGRRGTMVTVEVAPGSPVPERRPRPPGGQESRWPRAPEQGWKQDFGSGGLPPGEGRPAATFGIVQDARLGGAVHSHRKTRTGRPTSRGTGDDAILTGDVAGHSIRTGGSG